MMNTEYSIQFKKLYALNHSCFDCNEYNEFQNKLIKMCNYLKQRYTGSKYMCQSVFIFEDYYIHGIMLFDIVYKYSIDISDVIMILNSIQWNIELLYRDMRKNKNEN